jgi:predicted small secreted protein
MKKSIFLFVITALVVIMGTGCGGTVKGVKHDVGNALSTTGNALKN